MNASLTLDEESVPDLGETKDGQAATPAMRDGVASLQGLIKPTRNASAARGRKEGTRKVRPTWPANAPDAAPRLASGGSALRQLLAAAAPEMFDGTRPHGEAKLVEVLTTRLCDVISSATARVRSGLGHYAASREPAERMTLQDALLVARLPVEEVLEQAAACFTPGELLAQLMVGCLTHAPDQLDTLRCVEMVCGERQLLAREAVLDLLCEETDEPPAGRLERLVERMMIERAAAVSVAVAASLEGFDASVPPRDRRSGEERSGEGSARSAQEQFIQLLRRGDSGSATDVLAGSAGVSRAAVRTAIFLRTAKGLASLTWRGGFDAATSLIVQSVLGRVAPEELVRPTEDGGFSLTSAEMLWQCRFLASDLPPA